MTIAWADGMMQVVHEFESPLFNKGLAMIQHGVSATGTPSPLMAEALYDAWADEWLAVLDSDAVFARTRILLEDVGFEYAGNRQGLNNSVAPAPQVTLLLNASVPLRSPRARSRMYPPLVLSQGDYSQSGAIAPGVIAGRQGLVDAYYDNLSSLECIPRVVQNVEGNSSPITPWPVIGSWTVNSRIATQRRRLR